MFLAKDAPEYRTGYSIALSFLCMSIAGSTAYFIACMVENHQRAKGSSKHVRKAADEKGVLGDLDPNYRYML